MLCCQEQLTPMSVRGSCVIQDVAAGLKRLAGSGNRDQACAVGAGGARPCKRGNQSSERLSDLAKVTQWVNNWCNDLNPHCLTLHTFA